MLDNCPACGAKIECENDTEWECQECGASYDDEWKEFCDVCEYDGDPSVCANSCIYDD